MIHSCGIYFDSIWKELSEDFQLSPEVTQKWLEITQTAYEEPHRFYHNKNHITDCWAYIRGSTFNREMKLAFMFHDVVYNPLKKDNEEQSVNLFKIFAEESHQEIDVDRIEYFIMGTKHNKTSYELARNDPQLGFFLDVDLSVLGSPKDIYYEYSQGIRYEYCILEEEYNVGRYNFLASLLKLDKIFHTKEFERFESRARKNIQSEMNYLLERDTK
jgi:predicted metal-dependent HD superfamily phosphohydrolase